MIPFVEDIITNIIEQKLKLIKDHIDIIDRIFPTSTRPNRNKLKTFIQKDKIKVTRGFPRDIATLPAFVIMLSGEHEAEEAIGTFLDDIDESLYGYKGYELMGTRMNTQYRIEVWSTNGDLTVMLYHLLQYILVSERDNLNLQDVLLQNIGGADLEPLPEYLPEFVYRRALMFEFSYQITFDDNFYFNIKSVDIISDDKSEVEDELKIEAELEIENFEAGTQIDDD